MTVRILTDTMGRRYVSRRRHRPCKQCGGQIARRGAGVKFCSQDCYAKSLGGLPFLNRRSPAKTALSLKCSHCGCGFSRKVSAVNDGRNYCSRQCSNTANLATYSVRAGARPTSLERLLYAALISSGVEFETQKNIAGFVVDAYLPATSTAIEVDGQYWHSRPENIIRDRRKDAALSARSVRVVRIPEFVAKHSLNDALRCALCL